MPDVNLNQKINQSHLLNCQWYVTLKVTASRQVRVGTYMEHTFFGGEFITDKRWNFKILVEFYSSYNIDVWYLCMESAILRQIFLTLKFIIEGKWEIFLCWEKLIFYNWGMSWGKKNEFQGYITYNILHSWTSHIFWLQLW